MRPQVEFLFYRPQRSWAKVIFTGRNEVVAKVMFLQVSVCPQGGCLHQCMLGCHTPQMENPPPPDGEPSPDGEPPLDGEAPPDGEPPKDGEPPWMENPPPWMENPPGWRTPPDGDPPKMQNPPRWRTPREADSSIWSMSGRYASYWNAFLFHKNNQN